MAKPTPKKEEPKKGQPAASSKALAKSAAPQSPAVTGANLLEEDQGSDAFGKDDLQIPRLKILQDLSPEVKKQEAAYIEDAEVGQIIDTVNKELFDGDEGIQVIPIAYRRTYLEWKANRGGFVADHGNSNDILAGTTQNDRKQNVLPNGNIINAVAEYFVFLLKDGIHTPFVLSFTGTQLKKSRQWNTMINQLQIPKSDGSGTFNPAMFARSYTLSTVPEKNDQGSWMGWKITPSEYTLDMPSGNDIYLAAREFRKAVSEGKVKASAPAEHEAGGGPGESDEAPM